MSCPLSAPLKHQLSASTSCDDSESHLSASCANVIRWNSEILHFLSYAHATSGIQDKYITAPLNPVCLDVSAIVNKAFFFKLWRGFARPITFSEGKLALLPHINRKILIWGLILISLISECSLVRKPWWGQLKYKTEPILRGFYSDLLKQSIDKE